MIQHRPGPADELPKGVPQPPATTDYDALLAIMEGTAGSTDDAFFRELVRHLAKSAGVDNAILAEFASTSRVRTLAYCRDGQIVPNVEYELAGTPCEDVVEGNVCHYPQNVAARFPHDAALTEMGIESYFGVPLIAADGAHLGHLCVFDRRPLPESPLNNVIFRVFAARATAELARLRMEEKLADSEQRFRDLYEEAPIAYVQEDMDSRFIRANRAAIKILGLQPSDVPGFRGLSLVPDNEEAQKLARDAFASIGNSTGPEGIVLELRRKSDSQPIWIQWWSRPDPEARFTRTMFIDVTDRILMEREKSRLAAQNDYLQQELKSVHNFDTIIGQSPAINAVFEKVRRVAATDATVLITGETGTGKELIARAIHSTSGRSSGPLIKVNCAALAPTLVESELFGHERGAFTGATERRTGRFELAHGGTIFLDEIGEVPLEVQAKLLRVLQERELERIGGNSSIQIDVRIIAATNRDLKQAIREGTFREDLFYRLNVFPLSLPPLRERPGDIELLARHILKKIAQRIGRKIDAIEPTTLERLCSYRWPGNVRELENVLERAAILSNEHVLKITPELFPGEEVNVMTDQPESVTCRSANENLESLQRRHILSTLAATNWVIDGPNGAANILGLHPNTLRSRLKKLGISRP